jgi:hypothetical protein
VIGEFGQMWRLGLCGGAAAAGEDGLAASLDAEDVEVVTRWV